MTDQSALWFTITQDKKLSLFSSTNNFSFQPVTCVLRAFYRTCPLAPEVVYSITSKSPRHFQLFPLGAQCKCAGQRGAQGCQVPGQPTRAPPFLRSRDTSSGLQSPTAFAKPSFCLLLQLLPGQILHHSWCASLDLRLSGP